MSELRPSKESVPTDLGSLAIREDFSATEYDAYVNANESAAIHWIGAHFEQSDKKGQASGMRLTEFVG